MIIPKTKKGIRCGPGEKLDPNIIKELARINKSKKNFPDYLKAIENLFELDPITSFNEVDKGYIAGFLEGEGSINVSAKKLSNASFGLLIDPEFSVTQVVNGFSNLHAILTLFRTGRIRHKSGSNATMVLIIDNRTSLIEKVIPFMKENTSEFASQSKKERLKTFDEIVSLLDNKGTLNFEVFKEQILPRWDALRVQRGQSNESFIDLKAAQLYISQIRKNLK